MLKNSLGIKASVFLKTRILGVIPPKNRRLSLIKVILNWIGGGMIV